MNKLNKTLILSLSAMAMMVACKKDDKSGEKGNGKEAPKAAKTTEVPTDKPTEVKKTPDAPKAEAVDATVALKACWAASNAKDEEALGKCLDANTEVTIVDHTPPMSVKGAETIVGMTKSRWAAFSDMKAAPQLVITNGQNIATILHVSGTNDGEMMGMPATNKKMSMFSAEIVTMTPEGKIAKERWWMDQGTMMHQMGMHENEMAPSEETAWAEPIWVKAESNETETANLALVKSMGEMTVKGDVDAYFAIVADDVSFRYAGHKEAAEGKEAYKKGFDMWMEMADHKGTTTEVWGAGDWVVSVSDTVATMKADMPGTKDTKGKSVKSTTLEFYQIADGKLKAHWVFENTMNYAAQLGLMDDKKGMHGEVKAGGEHGEHGTGKHEGHNHGEGNHEGHKQGVDPKHEAKK